jgi:hypothetical protein
MNDELAAIFDRIANGQFTDADMVALQQLLKLGDREVKAQFAKFNVNIGDGKHIQIGDKIVYQQWDNFNPLGMRICLPPAGVLIWKKTAISELVGFDSNFYEGFEDFELLTRATINNLLIVVVDSIEYFYQRGQKSLSQSWDYHKEVDLLKSVLMNSKKLCEHKYLEYLEIELAFGRKLNYSSIDLIFNKIKGGPSLLYSLKKFRNNYYLLSIWKALPESIRRFIFKLVVE